MVDDTKKNRGAAALNTLLYPQVAAPLDTREVFYSLEDFKAYVRQDKNYAPAGYDAADIQFLKDIAPYSYAGQVVAVVSGDVTTLYKIDKVGGDVEGVNYSAIGGDVAADLGALTGRVGALETTVSAIPSTYQTQALPSISGYASAQLSVEGALAEVMGKALANESAIASHQASYESLVSNVGSIDSRVSVIEGAYASTGYVNDAISGLASVYETVSNVDSKLGNYYTSTQADAKFETIANVSAKLSNYYTKEQADANFMTEKEVDDRVNKVITDAVEGDTLTSLTEIVEYINTHGGEASAMMSAIDTLEDKVDVIEGQLSGIGQLEGDVKKYVDDKVSGLNIGDYAKASDLQTVSGKVGTLEGKVSTIEGWAASTISAADITKWNAAEENAHNSAVASASAMVAEEASIRASADDALSARIDAEVSARISGDNALSGRLDLIEAKPFDTYASISYVDAEISKVAAAATKVEKSNVNGNILVDGAEVVVYNDEALAERVTNAEASIGTNAEAIASNAQHFTELQGTVTSIDTRVTNLESGLTSYATVSYVDGEIDKLEEADSSILTRLSLVEDSLGLGGEGTEGGVAEQIATIKTEIWGTAGISDLSRIDKLEMADITIGQRIDGVDSKVVSNTSAIGSIDDRVVVLESNAVLSVSAGDNLYAEIGGNQLTLSINVDVLASELVDNYASTLASGIASQLPSNEIIKHVFGVESIASNAVALVSSQEIVSALDDLGHNHDAIKSTVQKAVTSVQTSTLVMSHSGNNLMIDLPSVIWLDGGSASDTYEAEEAVYNELLNNEYGN